MTFVDAALIDVGDLYVAVPQPEGWAVLDIDGDWPAQVAGLVRATAAVALAATPGVAEDDHLTAEDTAEAEGAATVVVGDAVREVLADVEPSVVLVAVDEGPEASLVVSVLAVAVLEADTDFEALVASSLEAAGQAQDDEDAVAVRSERAELPDRVLVRQVAEPEGDDAAGLARATVLVHLIATGTVVLLAGTAVGPGAEVLTDVWSDIACELNAVSSELPPADALVEEAP